MKFQRGTHIFHTPELEAAEKTMEIIHDCANRHTVPWREVLDFIREEELPEDVVASILCYCRMEGIA